MLRRIAGGLEELQAFRLARAGVATAAFVNGGGGLLDLVQLLAYSHVVMAWRESQNETTRGAISD
jgi:hypothetical protein